MPDTFNPLKYRPKLHRDERDATAWEVLPESTTRLEKENGQMESDLPASEVVDHFKDTQKTIEEYVKELENTLPSLTLEEDEWTERALEETGHTSVFRPVDYRKLFEEKESSPGAYLTQVIETQIEGEEGDIEWEKYIEYLELLEELNILDSYIHSLLYPLFNFEEDNINPSERFKEAERKWREAKSLSEERHEEAYEKYKKALYTDADAIPSLRDYLHNAERNQRKYRQEDNQLKATLQGVASKVNHVVRHVFLMEQELQVDIDKEEIVNDLTRLTENDSERKETLRNHLLMLKQTIDLENNKKKSYKDTRRNLYSKDKQLRIIDEYETVNRLYREDVLPAVHHMRAFQDQTTDLLNTLYNESAASLLSNHQENREKAYETYLIQISTSQSRLERLNCISSKHKARVLYTHLLDVYNENQEERG